MKKTEYDTINYEIRIQASICLSLLIMILLFRFWPERTSSLSVFEIRMEEQVAFSTIQITRQQSGVVRPARPVVRLDLADEVIIEDPIPDINIDLGFERLSSVGPPGAGDSGQIVVNPDRNPRVLRIVEPVTPQVVLAGNVRADIVAALTVNAMGNVEEVAIVEIRLFRQNGSGYEIVGSIDQGIIQATIEAARQWQFRPATVNNEAVKSVSRHVFSFGK